MAQLARFASFTFYMCFSVQSCNTLKRTIALWSFIRQCSTFNHPEEFTMNSIIWWVGFIVILLAVLSFVGLR